MNHVFNSLEDGTFPLVLKIFATAAAFALLLAAFFIGKLCEKIRNSSKEKEMRKDAVKRSRAVLGGQFAEQIAPFLPGFPCNPADARFVGKPVDFIAFPGLAEGKPIEEILIVEVKTGNSKLSAREKEIRDLVEKGKVRYAEYHFSSDN